MNIDGLKAKIDWYRLLFTFASIVCVASISWFYVNSEFAALKYLIVNISIIISSIAGMLVLAIKIKKYIKILGEK